jgi:hypothetical protein
MLDFSRHIADSTVNFTGRAWVFEEINKWLAQSARSRFFLLTGEPGSGKTSLAARLSQFSSAEATPPESCKLLTPGFLTAIHFCSARDSTWVDPLTFAQALGFQLLRKFPHEYAAAFDVKDTVYSVQGRAQVETVHAGAIVAGVYLENVERLVLSGIDARQAFNRGVRNPLENLYKRGFDKSITILVDGLDEALTYESSVTIVRLLAGLKSLSPLVRFILTSRKDGRVENELLEADGIFISAPEYKSKSRQDILEYVEDHLCKEHKLAEQLARLSHSERAAIGAKITDKADENFQYVTFLLKAMAQGQRSLQELDGLPDGLDELYADSLRRVVTLGKKEWSRDYAPLIGILSVAQEALTFAQLRAFTGFSGALLWGYLGDLEQFVETLPPKDEAAEAEKAYRLYHQSVVDFLRRPTLRIKKKVLRNEYYLVAEEWHRRVADFYLGSFSGKWPDCDAYGLHHLATHLFESTNVDALRGLIDEGWIRARYEGDNYTYYGLLADAELVWRAVMKMNEEAARVQRPVSYIGDEVRCALCFASVSSIAAGLSCFSLISLSHYHGWTPLQALSYAGRIPDPRMRFEALGTLASYFPEVESDALTQALMAAQQIEDRQERVLAFTKLLPCVPEALQAQTLIAAVEGIRQLEDTTIQWGELVPYQGHKSQRVHTGHRSSALLGLYKAISGSATAISAEGLRAVCETDDKDARTLALMEVASHLGPPWSEMLAVWGQAPRSTTQEKTACDLADTTRAPHSDAPSNRGEIGDRDQVSSTLLTFQNALRGGLAGYLLLSADDEGSSKNLVEKIVRWAVYLPADLLPEALQAIQAMSSGERSMAIAALARRLPDGLLTKALAIARDIPDDAKRYEAVAALAPRLSDSDLLEELTFVRTIADTPTRAKAVATLARHLPSTAISNVLEMVMSFAEDDLFSLRYTVAEMAPHLPTAAFAAMLEIVKKLDDHDRAMALAALAPRLPKELLPQALAMAERIAGGMASAKALIAFIPRLEGTNKTNTLWEVLEKTKSFWGNPNQGEFEVLLELTQLLPEHERSRAWHYAIIKAKGTYHPGRSYHSWNLGWRLGLLVGLVRRVTGPSLLEAANAALDILSELRYVDAVDVTEEVAMLARYLPRESLAQAESILGTASIIPKNLSLEIVADGLQVANLHKNVNWLFVLAERVPMELLPKALSVAHEIGGDALRAELLSELAHRFACLDVPDLYDAWRETLRGMAHLERRKFLYHIAALPPVVRALGGERTLEEVFRAIRIAGDWWP